MKKIALLLLTALLLCTTACNGSASAPASSPGTSTGAQTYTGILDQINDDMILVIPENDDSTSYSFDTEGITVDAKLGDKVTVTYTGNINDVESLLEASKVEVLK